MGVCLFLTMNTNYIFKAKGWYLPFSIANIRKCLLTIYGSTVVHEFNSHQNLSTKQTKRCYVQASPRKDFDRILI